jgi:DeoR family fructose operon transcriptional repressor
MLLMDRWKRVLDYIKENKFASAEELMNEFNISKSTVRRMLMAMEEQSLVKRTRGGVEIADQVTDIPHNLESVLKENKEAKLKIAKKAASLIKDGDFVFIDSGTTCYYLIDFISTKNVTVVTNGIIHIQKLFEKGINTYILGGYANLEENLILGEDTVNKISRMNFNISFIGTMGIDSVGGFTTFASFDGELKKAVIKSSQACYVLADTSKFNVRRFYSYGDFSEAAVITNSMVDFDSDKLNIIYTDK